MGSQSLRGSKSRKSSIQGKDASFYPLPWSSFRSSDRAGMLDLDPKAGRGSPLQTTTRFFETGTDALLYSGGLPIAIQSPARTSPQVWKTTSRRLRVGKTCWLARRESFDSYPDLESGAAAQGQSGDGEGQGSFEFGPCASCEVVGWCQVRSAAQGGRLHAECRQEPFRTAPLRLSADMAGTCWMRLVEAHHQRDRLRCPIETNEDVLGFLKGPARCRSGEVRGPFERCLGDQTSAIVITVGKKVGSGCNSRWGFGARCPKARRPVSESGYPVSLLRG